MSSCPSRPARSQSTSVRSAPSSSIGFRSIFTPDGREVALGEHRVHEALDQAGLPGAEHADHADLLLDHRDSRGLPRILKTLRLIRARSSGLLSAAGGWCRRRSRVRRRWERRARPGRATVSARSRLSAWLAESEPVGSVRPISSSVARTPISATPASSRWSESPPDRSRPAPGGPARRIRRRTESALPRSRAPARPGRPGSRASRRSGPAPPRPAGAIPAAAVMTHGSAAEPRSRSVSLASVSATLAGGARLRRARASTISGWSER